MKSDWKKWAELQKEYDEIVKALCFEPYDEFSLDAAAEFKNIAKKELSEVIAKIQEIEAVLIK